MSQRLQSFTGVVLDERTRFTLRELCSACGVHAELVIEMVEEGLLHPRGRAPEEWSFPGSAVVRARTALRLVNDLRVNWPGAALALDLLEEVERLRRAQRPAGRRLEAVRIGRGTLHGGTGW